MKKLLLILLCLPMIGLGQTYIPDPNFEAYLEANGMGNGVPNDNLVPTASIDTVTSLFLFNSSIHDLTGIEDFVALTSLECNFNFLSSLDLSQNVALTRLLVTENNLSSLDLSQNIALLELICNRNSLTSLDVSQNTALIDLACGEQYISTLDLSNNTNLEKLECWSGQLTSLDLRNTNNINMTRIELGNNPNLYCISVDNSTYSTNNWSLPLFEFDPQHYFNNNCSGTAIEEHVTNKKLIKTIDILGRETKQTKQPLFYIYDDGTVEKKIIIE